MKKIILSLPIFLSLLTCTIKPINAQIINKAVGPWGSDAAAAKAGTTFVQYFVVIWNSLIAVGALLVLMYFLWGAFEWITAGGDSNKLGSARNRMLQSVIGLFILVTSYTLIGFISNLFFGTNYNILKPTFFIP